MPLLSIGISIAAASSIAFAAWRARSLTMSGALAATVVGAGIMISGGWRWGLLLIAFFLSSSLLSRVVARVRPSQGLNVKRGATRDAVQVVANGGIAFVIALVWLITERDWLAVAFAASVAAAAADTWATEIGAFSKRRPRLITTGKPVERGVSGGVSMLGTIASIAGAVFIAGIAALVLDLVSVSPASLLVCATIAGVAGSLTDSLLGATLQIHYRCPQCNELTERPVHRCGTTSIPARGHQLFTNDTVNTLAIAVGATIGAAGSLLV